MRQYRDLLKDNPGFARLWLAHIVSLLGDWFNLIVLVALVARYSDGSGLAVSLFLLVRMLAPILVSPYAGVLADRLNRRHLMILSDLLRAVIVLFFLVARDPSLLWLIYVLSALQFTLTAIFEPARAALVPQLVPRESLVLANTLDSISWSAMLAIGALAGGVVAALLGADAALVIDALTFLVSAALVWSIRVAPTGVESIKSESDPVQKGGLIDGLRYARQHPRTVGILLVKAGGSIASLDSLIVVLATQVFTLNGSDEQALGLLYMAAGIGAVLGPVLLNRLNDGAVETMRRLITLGFVLLLLGTLLMAGASSLGLLAVAWLIRAMGGSANWTYSSIIMQKTIPNDYMGRMFALDNLAFQVAAAVGTLITGFLVDLVGPEGIAQVILFMSGISTISLLLWLVGQRRIRLALVPAEQTLL